MEMLSVSTQWAGLGGQHEPINILIRSEQIILLKTQIKTHRNVQLEAVKVSSRNAQSILTII